MSWHGYALEHRHDNTYGVRYILVDEESRDIEPVCTKKEANKIIKSEGRCKDAPNRFRLVSLEPPREDES